MFQRVCWVIFYYYFMVLCIFHPLWMSTKRNQATQKNFQATQLWVEAYRLRTMDLDCSNYSYASKFFVNYIQRWSRGHKARGQGQGQGHKKNPRPRPRPRTAFPRTDTLEAKDRNARGQGQGPRTQSASALQKKKKKKVFTKIFQAISKKKKKKKKKKGLHKNFSSDLHEITLSIKFFNRSTKF